MTNKLIKELMRDAFNYGFKVILENSFFPYTPTTVIPFNKTIILNNNWHNKKQLSFQLAHEMEHVSSVKFKESLGMDQYLEDMVQEEMIKYYQSFY